MAEYIEREYAIDAVLDVYYDTPDIDLSGEKFEAAIRKIPADDVAPVRHGSIIETIEESRMKMVVACCGADFTEMTCWMTPNYCPNCGAKMDLEAT